MTTAVQDFHTARQAMLQALAAWMETDPPPCDLMMEIAGTFQALAQLLDLSTATTDAPPD